MEETARGAAVLLGALLAAIPAQHVVPKTMVGVEGGSATSIPFGVDRPVRNMCIYNGRELPWTVPTLITGIDLRADNDDPGNTTFPAKQYLLMHLWISTAGRTAEAADPEFEKNHGNDAVQVIRSRRLSLPMQPRLSTAPRPFTVPLLFDSGFFFVHDLTPVRGPRSRRPGLTIDFIIELQPTGPYRLDTPFLCDSQPTQFGSIDPLRCKTSAGPLMINSNNSLRGGDRVIYTVTNMPADAAFAVALGSREDTWLGLRLPIDLTPVGAPGCFINTDWLSVTPGLGNSSGVGQVWFPIPRGRYLIGTDLRAQAICNDLTANPLFHVTSTGVRSTICGPLGVARVFTVGDWQARTGSVTYGSAFIFQTR